MYFLYKKVVSFVSRPSLEVSAFVSPSGRVAQLNPQEVGSIFIAFCNSQETNQPPHGEIKIELG
jgi:hypothetical protein